MAPRKMRTGFICLLIAFTCEAASYFIDATSGSDGANGLTAGTAWKTMMRAQTNVAASDSIFLKRGETWNESFTNLVSHLTIDAYGSGALPTLDGQGVRRRVLDCGSATNSLVKNLHLKHGGGGTGALWINTATGTNTIEDCLLEKHDTDACASGNADSHSIIRRCTMQDAFDDGFTLHTTASGELYSCLITNCQQGINHSGTDIWMLVEDTSFINNGSADIAPLGTAGPFTFNRCQFLGKTGGDPWKFLDSTETNVTYNYCTFNASMADAVSDPSIQIASPVFMNNCVFYGGGFGTISVTATGVLRMTNCIVKDWWRDAFIFAGGTNYADHCILNNITVKSITETSTVSTGDPLFVSAATGNFRLANSSTGLGAGIYIGLTSDLAGVTVANPPAVGAYEPFRLNFNVGTIGRPQ